MASYTFICFPREGEGPIRYLAFNGTSSENAAVNLEDTVQLQRRLQTGGELWVHGREVDGPNNVNALIAGVKAWRTFAVHQWAKTHDFALELYNATNHGD